MISSSIMGKGNIQFIRLLCFVIVIITFLISSAPVWADDPVKVPRVEVLPFEGPVGTTVYARIYDYTARKQVIIIFGSGTTITAGTIIVAKETTDDTGYAVVNFPVDLYPAGRYNVIADDGTNKKMASFKVMPKITLDSTSGFVDSVVAISGNGFAAKKPISILYDTLKMATVDADDNGRISGISFVVPASAKGDHTIRVQDSEGNYVTAVYNIKQKMTISPSSTTVGSEVTITGTGFQPKDIVFYFDDKDVAAVHVDNNGSFIAKFKVPTCADGIHKIKADDGVSRAYCDLNILSTVTVSPNAGNIGMAVGIQGSGFRPGFPITINYDTTKIDAPSVDQQGTFTHSIKVPKSRSGQHTITISDGVNTQKVVFTVESTPPPPPTLVSPANSARAEKGVHFEWSAVSDPSGVSYNLEIARDSKFSEILISTVNIYQTTFDLPEDNKLLPSQQDPYYWRVKAIDNASNEGPWSAISAFHKGYTLETVMTNMPDWTKYILIGLGAVLIAFTFFCLGRILSRAGRVDDEPEAESEALPELNVDSGWGNSQETNDWSQT